MTEKHTKEISYQEYKTQVLEDYRIATMSRECSLMGRREVLTGKAKFGIFGAGKELAQIAWAKAFQKGDFRSNPGKSFRLFNCRPTIFDDQTFFL